MNVTLDVNVHVLPTEIMVTVTAHVLFAGAVWFEPAATLTVIVALPFLFEAPVTVMVVPLTDTVAMPVSLLEAVTAPFPVRVTVIVPLGVLSVSDSDVGLMLILPAALLMVQFTLLAEVVPSAHL